MGKLDTKQKGANCGRCKKERERRLRSMNEGRTTAGSRERDKRKRWGKRGWKVRQGRGGEKQTQGRAESRSKHGWPVWFACLAGQAPKARATLRYFAAAVSVRHRPTLIRCFINSIFTRACLAREHARRRPPYRPLSAGSRHASSSHPGSCERRCVLVHAMTSSSSAPVRGG
jgi:hypothetical protein